jgi:hypothetical protein
MTDQRAISPRDRPDERRFALESAARISAASAAPKKTLFDKMEAFVSRLSSGTTSGTASPA